MFHSIRKHVNLNGHLQQSPALKYSELRVVLLWEETIKHFLLVEINKYVFN
jgi:hypothetical protein